MKEPWLPRAMNELFDCWDTEDWFMWEWGSGRSTQWFGKRVKKLWSMEHKIKWFQIAKKACENMENVFLMHKPLEGDYIKEITRFPDQFFAVINPFQILLDPLFPPGCRDFRERSK